jgi:predicted O-methyltransferase YrrM
MSAVKRLVAAAQALATVLAREGVPGMRAHGVYVPYAYPGTLAPLDEDECLDWLEARFEAAAGVFRERLDEAAAHSARFAAWRHADPDDRNRPRFDQQWFSGLDAAMAYAMVRRLAPRRIVEVGSGHSTRFMARAVADGALHTTLHSIDPVPRRAIDALCNRITRASVTAVPLATFDALEAGDLLFLDGSHALVPGSDVEHLFTRVLPRLAPGVVVHVHDVFLPWGYPRAWHRRAYTEQSALACLLAGGERFDVLCPNAWLRRREPQRVAALEAYLAPGALESSLWMQVRAP